MPINPNIALGIQPVQQPNILGQMGQIMAIRAAQQEMEGNEEARNYFSKPADQRGDPSRLLGTKQGQAAYKALNEGQIKQLEATQKRIGLIGAGAGAVLQNPTVENFRNIVENLVKNQVYSREDADKAIATIGNDASKIPSFVTPLYRQAIDADKQLADATSRANNAATVGASYYSSNVSRENAANRLKFDTEKFEFEKANPGFEYKTLDNGNIVAVNKRSNAVTLLRNPNAATPPPATLPPAAAKMLVTPGAAPANVNALTQSAPNQAGPTVAAANALTANAPLRAAPRPGYEYNAQGQQVPIKDPAAVVSTVTDAQGTVRGLNYKGEVVSEAKGMGKPSAYVEKTAGDKVKLERDLNTAIRQLTKAIEPGGLLEQSTGSGIGAMYDASAGFFGKATEGATAAAQLAPIADLVLKMVPRFEGPQSVKDVESYEKASGDLANSKKPVEIRREAAKTIIKLMKERKGQFEMKGDVGGGGGGGGAGAPADPLGIR